MRSGKAHAVALDKVVEINGGLARHDVKSRAGLGPVGMVRGSGFLTEFKSVRKRSHADAGRVFHSILHVAGSLQTSSKMNAAGAACGWCKPQANCGSRT